MAWIVGVETIRPNHRLVLRVAAWSQCPKSVYVGMDCGL